MDASLLGRGIVTTTPTTAAAAATARAAATTTRYTGHICPWYSVTFHKWFMLYEVEFWLVLAQHRIFRYWSQSSIGVNGANIDSNGILCQNFDFSSPKLTRDRQATPFFPFSSSWLVLFLSKFSSFFKNFGGEQGPTYAKHHVCLQSTTNVITPPTPPPIITSISSYNTQNIMCVCSQQRTSLPPHPHPW